MFWKSNKPGRLSSGFTINRKNRAFSVVRVDGFLSECPARGFFENKCKKKYRRTIILVIMIFGQRSEHHLRFALTRRFVLYMEWKPPHPRRTYRYTIYIIYYVPATSVYTEKRYFIIYVRRLLWFFFFLHLVCLYYYYYYDHRRVVRSFWSGVAPSVVGRCANIGRKNEGGKCRKCGGEKKMKKIGGGEKNNSRNNNNDALQ